MITFIAHVRVKAGMAGAYEALLEGVAASTRAHEPEVVYYAWARSVADPDLFVVIEVYKDVAAHRAHMASPWVAESLPKVAGLMSEPPDIKQYVSEGSAPVEGSGVFYRGT